MFGLFIAIFLKIALEIMLHGKTMRRVYLESIYLSSTGSHSPCNDCLPGEYKNTGKNPSNVELYSSILVLDIIEKYDTATDFGLRTT